MGDLLGSLTKPHTVVVRWLNWGHYRLERNQGSPVEGFRPCPVGVVTGGIRACTQPEMCRRGRRAPRGVDCDDLSGRVRGTGSYLVSNPTSPGWLRKCLKGKRFSSIKTEAFSERLAKGFVGTPKLSVLQWE